MATKIQFSFRMIPNNQRIHFKVDGGRFDTEKTVKVNIDAKYCVDICVRPPRNIEKLLLHGGEVGLTEKTSDEDATTYQGEWLTSGIDKCKKGIRTKLPITIQFAGGVEFSTSLQCKFYPPDEKEHSHWGSVLNQLEYECQQMDGQGHYEILKETFR